MLALLISFIISILISGTCMVLEVKSGAIAYGVFGFFVSLIGVSLLVRKKIQVVNGTLEEMMAVGQKRMNHKINQFQNKPGGNVSLIQKQLERDQHDLFKKALEFTKKMEPFKKWNVLMGKQISTMRLQFLYQLKEFDQVDQIFSQGLLTRPILSDPLLVAMKMARAYKNKEFDGAEKVFKRHVVWFRGENGALLYGVMSWIYVKQDRAEDARQLLAKGKEKMYDETLSNNWDVLTNDKVKSFSNAGFGDQWYSLYLENPPAPKRQKMRGNAKGNRPF